MATAGSLLDSAKPGVLAPDAGGSGDHDTGGKYAKGIISRIYKQVYSIQLKMKILK